MLHDSAVCDDTADFSRFQVRRTKLRLAHTVLLLPIALFFYPCFLNTNKRSTFPKNRLEYAFHWTHSLLFRLLHIKIKFWNKLGKKQKFYDFLKKKNSLNNIEIMENDDDDDGG